MATKRWRADDWTWTVQGGQSLWEALRHQGISKHQGAQLAKEKLIFVNGNRVDTHTLLEKGDEIRVQFPKEALDYEAVPMDLAIVYEDEDLLILDKPSGLTVNSKGQVSLANGVAAYFKKQGIRRKIRFLNRLDRDTSGCIVIAKSALAQGLYQQQIEQGTFEKWYETEVDGELTGSDTLVLPMGRSMEGIRYEVQKNGKETKTYYEALPVNDSHESTRVHVKLLTGKTHQIRVAMQAIGHPLQGDQLYGGSTQKGSFYLRAYRVSFQHMRTGKKLDICI